MGSIEERAKENSPAIQVENVSKIFQTSKQGNVLALNDITLSVPHGEFVTLVGPSGCGKSTLLRLIAGLSSLSSGRILFQGAEVRELNTKVGYVPQESKLFPWLTLEENVGFGLDARRYAREERESRTRHFINLAGLNGFEKHYPAQLSGGMSKRASIIRALAYDPPVILMD
ncbi:MAG: ATP-binding cassette domain-containing protein [Deltaproteobacteria bacterium]|nr:ATP-binding cassette domain-containing protein [Deltaproteobacteria bacterium]